MTMQAALAKMLLILMEIAVLDSVGLRSMLPSPSSQVRHPFHLLLSKQRKKKKKLKLKQILRMMPPSLY